jgi:hypothetical protein
VWSRLYWCSSNTLPKPFCCMIATDLATIGYSRNGYHLLALKATQQWRTMIDIILLIMIRSWPSGAASTFTFLTMRSLVVDLVSISWLSCWYRHCMTRQQNPRSFFTLSANAIYLLVLKESDIEGIASEYRSPTTQLLRDNLPGRLNIMTVKS